MKKYNIGFIGSGKMAGAIIRGLLKSGFTTPENLLATQAEQEGIEEKKQVLGINIILDNKILAQKSDVIFIATKPNQVVDVIREISPFITSNKLIVSIAAGVKTEKLETNLPPKTRVIRVMPNTPALVKLGMFGVCKGSKANDEDLNLILELLSVLGKCITVEESQIDIVTAISGSGPAFFYQVIEDIARAGEKLGLDYEKSLILATQTALGSAQMVFNRGETTVQTLIDNVATKGGCTFVGITEMKEQHSDKLFYDVIDKTTQKANALGK
jgi:pyrroline-5-carboxylate reductase